MVEERIKSLPPCPTPVPTVPVTCPTTPIAETQPATDAPTKMTTLAAAIKNQSKANKLMVKPVSSHGAKLFQNNFCLVLVFFANVFFLSMF